jgi:putative hydrolase of the HAD superfamily
MAPVKGFSDGRTDEREAMTIKAVLWDFGGVLTTSPFEAFNRFEAERGLPRDFIRRVNAADPDGNAWARLERNAIDLDTFDRLFRTESTALGHAVDGRDILPLLVGDLRPEMVRALEICRGRLRCVCVTNNANYGEGPSMTSDRGRAAEIRSVFALFHDVVESRLVGVRKPDPRIYEIACEVAGAEPAEIIYLDDLGINLKPARALGMTTIKVGAPRAALAELQAAVGFDVLDPPGS